MQKTVLLVWITKLYMRLQQGGTGTESRFDIIKIKERFFSPEVVLCKERIVEGHGPLLQGLQLLLVHLKAETETVQTWL
jgi:hypothetical protein